MMENMSVSDSHWDEEGHWNSTSYPATDKKSMRYGDPLSNSVFIVLVVNFCVNGLLLCGVAFRFGALRMHRNAVLLVAHLALVSLLFSVLLTLNIKFVTELAEFGQYYCPILSYCKAVLASTLWANLSGIVHESIRSIQEHERSFTVYLNILRVWVIVGVLNLPQLFMSKSASGMESSCIPVWLLLMDSLFITVAYETCRLILHTAVFGYIIYAVFYIRSKLHYIYALCPVPSDSMRRKIKTVRVVYYYLIAVTLILFPGIIARFVLRVISLLYDQEELVPSNASRVTKPLKRFLVFTVFFGTILNPFISMILIDRHFLTSLRCCANSSSNEQHEGISLQNRRDRGHHVEARHRNPHDHTSRVYTFVKSSTLTTSELRSEASVTLSNAEKFAGTERLI